ncbi:ABC transporter substrate-binding protein [Streptomyces showdoensis]|uniref:ABC transporter substrate-binding protein n=1 Tax=Streptomyces showdoensis TaxID=68268 RepID=A0A2P2GDL9_STREW|nr:ABC transporter substrate-binding protein [Streptomyces showdoensis]KKZ69608.1 ABC transporter substrate-binding protein [Streptomyces showdoensis]
MRSRSAAIAAASVLSALAALAASGCAPQETAGSASGPSSSAAKPGSCAADALATKAKGKLTVGTDTPAYAPWFQDDDPSNSKGYESAVAYAVAQKLGFAKGDVVWQKVAFNNAFAPGAKTFDFDINQVSINEDRRKAVDLSSGYYDVRQTIIALKNSKAAKATSLADLKGAKLGAQVGTTSLDVINDLIKPDQQPSVFQKNDLAKAALKNGQVDAIVVDLPTAFYITGAEVTEAKVVGQFETPAGAAKEQFGLVLDKDSALTSCVSQAVDALRKDGTLAAIEKQWLSDAAGAPVLK